MTTKQEEVLAVVTDWDKKGGISTQRVAKILKVEFSTAHDRLQWLRRKDKIWSDGSAGHKKNVWRLSSTTPVSTDMAPHMQIRANSIFDLAEKIK